MAKDPDLPRRGTRITTPEGEWEVQELILLGHTPLHYAVRVLGPAGAVGGKRLALVLSRPEFEGLQAKARAPADAAGSAGRQGKPRR